MIYPNIEKEEWIKKYPVTARDYRCPACKMLFETTIPIYTNEYAGLASPIHECGVGFVGYALTPRKTEKIEFWKTALT